MQHQEDDKALAWTMDLIAKEELYKTTFTDSKSSSGMHLTAEMTDWLRSNLQASLPGAATKGGGKGAPTGLEASAARAPTEPVDLSDRAIRDRGIDPVGFEPSPAGVGKGAGTEGKGEGEGKGNPTGFEHSPQDTGKG